MTAKECSHLPEEYGTLVQPHTAYRWETPGHRVRGPVFHTAVEAWKYAQQHFKLGSGTYYLTEVEPASAVLSLEFTPEQKRAMVDHSVYCETIRKTCATLVCLRPGKHSEISPAERSRAIRDLRSIRDHAVDLLEALGEVVVLEVAPPRELPKA